ncbi:hypothetical protein CCHR01_18835 [Colletotrichum chrysophilum]|uniref:Uncharacterized protein n=1 Tax=Colletotrichum chrysophilum TaxID=1836956 RepID=A0AAD8ZZC3_9PEZI|nr:hypothetical protein CCHR01_18835 [Colletotrichum chrysophilum]
MRARVFHFVLRERTKGQAGIFFFGLFWRRVGSSRRSNF